MPPSRLRRLPVFDEVPEARLLALEPRQEERAYRPNQTVYAAGEPCDGLYAVLKGAVILRAERLPEHVQGEDRRRHVRPLLPQRDRMHLPEREPGSRPRV